MLFILGGVKNKDIFDKNLNICYDELFQLDLKSYQWTPIKMGGAIPKTLGSWVEM